MKIIPAIDIYNGKCVRLYKGDYNLKTEYSNNPVDVAKRFESEGAKFLHLVDLEGAKSNKIFNHKGRPSSFNVFISASTTCPS